MAKIVVGFYVLGSQAAGTCAEPDIEGKDVFTSKVPLRRILPSFLHCKAAHVKDENTKKWRHLLVATYSSGIDGSFSTTS